VGPGKRRPRAAAEKLLYSKADAAYALSLSKRSIDYLISGKKLEARRIGNRVLIPAESVRRFARENHFDSVAS
jgi:excisionase family DNA binding protein